jgi:hypothetical protein
MRKVLVVREVDTRRKVLWTCGMFAAFRCHLRAKSL